MISDIHRRLREATQADHGRVEDRLDILSRMRTPAGRRALVEGFSGLHADAEAALSPWLAQMPGLAFDARRRSPCLMRDLETLGGLAPHRRPIAVRSAAEALGVLYVLEGSALGGRVIRKQVVARGGDMTGLSFLDPYGDATGAQWRTFLDVLAAEARTEADAQAMIGGARAGFELAEHRLCGEPVNG